MLKEDDYRFFSVSCHSIADQQDIHGYENGEETHPSDNYSGRIDPGCYDSAGYFESP